MLGHKRHIAYFIWLTLCAALFIGMYADITLRAYQKPYPNWDRLAYTGAATLLTPHESVEDWYQQTQKKLPGIDLSKGKLSQDSDAFYQQMPFYTIKPFYVGMIAALEWVGAPIGKIPHLISIGSFALMGMILLLWKPVFVERGLWWLALTVFIKIDASFAWLGRLATPDALSLLLILCAMYAWLCRRSYYGLVVFVLLAIATRPDIMALVVMLAVALIGKHGLTYWQAGLLSAAAILLYGLITWLSGNYGWCNLMEYSFFSKVAHPELLTCELTWQRYEILLSRGFRILIKDTMTIWVLVFGLLASLGGLVCKNLQNGVFLRILLAVTISFALRFAVFPHWEPRYYFVYDLLIWLISTELIGAFIAAHSATYRRWIAWSEKLP